jgi:aryl-alcohol dehydrogenase-like predicted oxidoreductase
MRRITVPGTSFVVSRFIFGTAQIFKAGSTSDRQRLLDAAYDHGLTHFDTAPYYGFGSAERDLKQLLKRHPDATVTTKVGIYSPGGDDQPDASVFARKAFGRLWRGLATPSHDWSVGRARTALEGSLRRLGRERIDLYMLHEPDFADVAQDEWLHWLQEEVTRGRVNDFGIALDSSRLAAFLAAPSRLSDVIQTLDSIDGREADQILARGRPLQITYSYVTEALRRDPRADVPEVLKRALARNNTGAVVVGTRRIARIKQFAQIGAGT